MEKIKTKEEWEYILNELKGNLLIALYYIRDGNVNLIRAERSLKRSLDKVSVMEASVI